MPPSEPSSGFGYGTFHGYGVAGAHGVGYAGLLQPALLRSIADWYSQPSGHAVAVGVRAAGVQLQRDLEGVAEEVVVVVEVDRVGLAVGVAVGGGGGPAS